MKKGFLLGIAAFGLIGMAGAGLSFKGASAMETRAEYGPEAEHKIVGRMYEYTKASWGDDWKWERATGLDFGTWDAVSEKFIQKAFIHDYDYFKFYVDGALLGYGEAGVGKAELLYDTSSSNDNQLRVRYDGYYNVTLSATAVDFERLTYRAQEGYKAGDTIYLQMKDAWKVADAKMAFKFIPAEGDAKWSGFLSEKTCDGIYKYELPDSFGGFVATKVQLIRFASDATDPATDAGTGKQWNYTSELTANAGLNAVWLPDTVKNDDGGFYAYDPNTYTLKVGDAEYPMSLNLANENEVFANITGAAKDELVQMKKNDGEYATLTPAASYANNLKTDGTLKVGGNFGIYVAKENLSSVWAGGYSPASLNLQNFCDYLLSNTIDGDVCSVSEGVLTNLQGMWAGTSEYGEGKFKLSADDRTEFKAASATYGYGIDYGSLVEEAYTRYMWLVNGKGMADFAGELPSSHIAAPLATNNNNAFVWVIAILGGTALIATAVVLFSRRRRGTK